MPQPQHPGHLCRAPWLHRLVIGTAVTAWLYYATRYGWLWAVLLSRHFGPGMNLLMFCVLGIGWIVVAIPAGAGALYVLMRGRCGTWPMLAAPPPQPPAAHTVVERIIFSPEAAEERFGIRGEVIMERETREGR
jgi:hypothetical protein